MDVVARIVGEPLFLLGDVHGRLERVERALRAAGLVDAAGALRLPPGSALVQVGDLVDRGREGELGPERLARARAAAPPELRVPDLETPRSAALLGVADLLGPDPASGAPPGAGPFDPALRARQRALAGAVESLATLRRFAAYEDQARASGAHLVCLLGNHDLDLLRGRFLYFPQEKACLLALCGLPPAAIAEHAARGLPLAELTSASPLLAWLAGRPLLAAGAGVLAVHGGPPRELASALAARGVTDLRGLDRMLAAAWARGLDRPEFAEGRSLFAPDRPEDDAVRDPALAEHLLALAGAEVLAVGHSPYLAFPKGRWVDAADPRHRPAIERPARLGRVLKLDTDLKRGGPAWLVIRERGGWRALREDGEPLELATAQAPAAAAATFAVAEAPGEGVDGEALDALQRALAAHPDRALAERVRSASFRLLGLGLSDVAPLEAALADGAPERAEAWAASAAARRDALARALLARGAGERRFCPALADLRVGPLALDLAPAVAREALRADPALAPLVCATPLLVRGEPRLRVRTFASAATPPGEITRALTAWPPEAAEVERLLREADGGPGAPALAPPRSPGARRRPAGPLDPALAEQARRWLALNAALLERLAPGLELAAATLAGGGPGRALARLPGADAPTLALQRLPGGALVLADAALLDPGARFLALTLAGEAPPQAELLLGTLPRLEAITLFCAASAEVAARVRLGEVEALGLSDERRPRWQRSPYLFTTPCRSALSHFPGKETTLRFVVPREELAAAVAAGLASAGVFLAHDGSALDPEARWGASDVALEVIALGAPGVAWLAELLA